MLDSLGASRGLSTREGGSVRVLHTLAILGCIGLSSQFATLELTAQNNADRAYKRVRVEKVRPKADTEVRLDEFWVTTDENGRRKVTMSGPLQNGKVERLVWTVDSRDNTYSIIRLTGNHRDDATRLRNAYEKMGRDVDIDKLTEHVSRSYSSSEETHRKIRIEAEDKAALFNLEQRQLLEDDPRGGPAGGCESEAGGQWATACAGFGWANVQTWEPARYVFNVNHLNETQTAATWVHYFPSGSFTTSRSGYCWANDVTFVYTHWYQLACIPTFTSSANYFDSARIGQYVNYDFSLYLFQVARPITITAEASVQSVYGMGNWGAQYWEDTENWVRQWYEPFFLSGIISGAAFEGDCQQYCEPSSLELGNCNDGNHYWDYVSCMCLNNQSPIIIDLENDDLNLTSLTDGVQFDIEATGEPVHVAWTRERSDDAFLVLDRNGNGLIDDGAELFGNNTPQPPVKRKRAEKNGFRALAVYDDPAMGGNGDDQITAADRIFDSLRLWKDLNHDGISQRRELVRLADEEVRGISLRYVRSKEVDQHGNAFRYRSHVTMDRHAFGPRARRQAVDVYLVAAQSTR
jgi:hypothetical protein